MFDDEIDFQAAANELVIIELLDQLTDYCNTAPALDPKYKSNYAKRSIS